MGNSKSGCSQWEYHGYCSCSEDYYYAQKIRWKSVPMSGEGWATTARIASLGITQFWHKGRQFSHDCIQAWVRCCNCSRFMYVTMEFSKEGKSLSWGRYYKIKSDSNAVVEANVSYKFSVVRKEYDRMPNSGYDLSGYNCKSWAKSLWNDL